MIHFKCPLAIVIFLGLVFVPTTVFGQGELDFEEVAVSESSSGNIFFPFVFYHEVFELTIGAAFAAMQYPQPQSALVGGFAVGSNGAVAGTVMLLDYQLPFGRRWYMVGFISGGSFDEFEVYTDGNPDFPNEDAGSNESDEDNFVEGDGGDLYIFQRYRYVLPIGHGNEDPLPHYELENGLLISGESGGTHWNPFKSGRSFIELEPFYRRQEFETSLDDEETPSTNGMQLSLVVDNRDFRSNPTKGYYTRLTYKQDFGWFDSENKWQVVEGSVSKYIDLGSSRRFRQQVLALNFWTSDSPSWNNSSTKNGEEKFERPPFFAGSTLGGVFRMRAYPAARFNDRAAIYYGAEYRVIPEWNPFDHIKFFDKYDIPWVEIALFGETGRVAPNWSLDTLHDDMKWDVGIGLRVFAQGLVFRLDTAVSEEGGGVQMMIAHPF